MLWRLRAFSLPLLSIRQETLHLGVQAVEKQIARFSIQALLKVMFVHRERLWTSPFHVFDQTPQPPLDLHFTLGSFVNIADSSCHQPMACLMHVCLDFFELASGVPVVFSIRLWPNLRHLK